MTDPFDAAAAAGHQLQSEVAADQQTIAAQAAQITELENELHPTPTPTPQPQPQPTLAWGVGPCDDPASLAAEEAALGKVAIIRHYQQPGEGVTSEPFAFSGGRDVVSSTKAPPAEIAAGKWDAQIRAKFAAAKAAGVRLYECPWHEPEQELDAGQFTIADLTAAFTRMHQIARQVDPAGQHIFTIHILMGFQLNQGGSVDKYMPTDLTVVDVLGFDPYQESPTYSAPPGHLLSRLAAFAAAHGKPWGVCEIGVNHLKFTGQGFYDTLTAVAREAATVRPAPLFVTYFDHNSRPGVIDNLIRTDPQAAAAWKAGQA